MRKTVILFSLVVAGLTAVWMTPGAANEAAPLFSVDLPHEFPDPAGTFEEVKQLILANYYTDDIDESALYWAAVQGMLRHVSPPGNKELATIWTAEEYDTIRHGLEGDQISIGIKSSFNAEDGSLTVTEVLPGSPAEGILLPRDRILRIDSRPLAGLSTAKIQEMLRGAEGSVVDLTVNRGSELLNLTVTRERFEIRNLAVGRLDDEVALAVVRRFSSGLSGELDRELAGLQAAGIRKLVLDLRDNPGGVFMEGLRAAELFLPENSIILRTLGRDTGLRNYISSNPDPFSFEIAVLVDDDTASAAEIMAGSLRDHGRAIILGTRTHGKGVFEKTYRLENDCRVKFITGVMYTPKGTVWQEKGLTPDFIVEQDKQLLARLRRLPVSDRLQADVGLITALKLLKRNYFPKP